MTGPGIPAEAKHAAREAAATVLPDLMSDLAKGEVPMLRLLRTALQLAADEDGQCFFWTQAAWRVGNSDGQGGVRMIGEWEEVPAAVPGHAKEGPPPPA